MGFYRFVLVSLTLLGIYVLVCSASLSSCPKPPACDQGFGLKNCVCVPCNQTQYRVVKSGLPSCKSCTEECSDERNLKEVIPCGPTQHRVCHCDRGFFCKSKAQFSCRRCLPCSAGTFSSKISMVESCQPYTDCSAHGLAVISNGTSTRDRQCAYPISRSTNSPVGSAETTYFSAARQNFPLPITTHEPQSTSQLPAMYHTATAVSSPINASSSSVSLLVVVALLVAAAMLVIFCTWHKHHLLKGKGWPFMKHLKERGRKEDTMGEDLYFVSQGLLDYNTGNVQQVDPPKQQVTVDHSGSGDSVSNNVGSIHIYSPKMVVLGANTAERREEMKPPAEVLAPLGTPHQEQGPVDRPPSTVTACVQEEEGKELSYPVPATSK